MLLAALFISARPRCLEYDMAEKIILITLSPCPAKCLFAASEVG